MRRDRTINGDVLVFNAVPRVRTGLANYASPMASRISTYRPKPPDYLGQAAQTSIGGMEGQRSPLRQSRSPIQTVL